jgi:hypothetical protein
VVLAGIHKLAVEHQASEARFIPHPATWLNQERWCDEEPKPNGKAGGYGPLRDPTEIARELGIESITLRQTSK